MKKTSKLVCLLHRKPHRGKCPDCVAELEHCGLCNKRVRCSKEPGLLPICAKCFNALSDHDKEALQPKPSFGRSATA